MMASQATENKNLEKCIAKLQEATSDNEKFAAMLMVNY
jgi:hypothetical protein